MIRYNKDGIFVLFGDDLHEAAQHVMTTSCNWSDRASFNNRASHSWDLGVGYDDALRMADTGWSEGARDFADKLSALPPNEAEPEYCHDVAGYMPDVPLYCAGDPMHMMNEGHPQGRKPIVHLVINAVAAGMIGAQDYANYGAAMTAMIGQIEASGRQVELDLVFVTKLNGPMRAVLGWKVKRAGDNVDLSAVAYSIAHPAAFRRIGFALIERTPRANQTMGLGHCGTLTKDLAGHINAEGAFLLGGIGESHGACSTIENALKFAANQINKAAGETIVEIKD